MKERYGDLKGHISGRYSHIQRDPSQMGVIRDGFSEEVACQWRPECEIKSAAEGAGWGHPWWFSGWESACQCRGHGFDPWFRRIPHAAGQVGPCVTAIEPVL